MGERGARGERVDLGERLLELFEEDVGVRRREAEGRLEHEDVVELAVERREHAEGRLLRAGGGAAREQRWGRPSSSRRKHIE